MAAVWPDSVVEETNLNHNICVLRRVLGERVTGQKYVETVPRQGYRFVAEVKELEGPDVFNVPNSWSIFQSLPVAPEKRPEERLPPMDSRPLPAIPISKQELLPAARWFQHRGIPALLAVVALLVAGYVGAQRLGLVGHSSASRIMLAVLPFENLTGDSGQEYVAAGLSHEIISELGGWNPAKLGVIAHTSSRVYLGVRKPVSEIGRELGVQYIVEGSVRRSDSRFRITVMLIRVADQTHLWAANYDTTIDDIMAMQVEVTRLIIREIGSRIAVEPGEGSFIAYPSRLESCHTDRSRTPAEHPQVGSLPDATLIRQSQPARYSLPKAAHLPNTWPAAFTLL
jgi:TolB-like protein